MSKFIYDDGWHKVCGYQVYVKNKRIIYGVSGDDWQQHTICPYQWYEWANCWVNAQGIHVEAFRSAYKRGHAMMM